MFNFYLQIHLTTAKIIPIHDHGGGKNPLFVQKSAIGRMEVFYPPLVLSVDEPGVAGRDRLVADWERGSRVTAN